MVAVRSQGNWRWEGPLGTPLGLVHWKRASSYHFLHRLLKRQNVKSLEVFQEQGFSFFGNPALLTQTG